VGIAVLVKDGGVTLGEIAVVVGNVVEIGSGDAEIGPQEARRNASQTVITKMKGAFISRPIRFIGDTSIPIFFLV
jgi:hypothetical protein